jgi:glycosyltransferase involved in cell wall biosynthesis
MTEVPPVTFAIPFYSGIRYLPAAIESVLAQDDPNWRALVCDDGTVPGVDELVHSYKNQRIVYYKNPNRLGMAANWNRCLELAPTDLVTLLHEDDVLLPNYCGVMRRAAAEHPSATAFYGQAHIIGPHGEPAFSFPDFIKFNFINPSPRATVVLEGERGVSELLRGDFIMCPTLCFRRSRLGALRFSEEYKFVQDIELTTQILVGGGTIVGLPDLFYQYRRHENNATAEYTRSLFRFDEESAYYDRVLELAIARGWRSCIDRARRRRIIKLNLGYVTLMSFARMRFSLGVQGLRRLIALERKTRGGWRRYPASPA